MKRDRLGRFLSPAASRQRGSSGRGSCGGGRARGRPARSGPDVAEAAAVVAARLGWGPARPCGDTGQDGADEAGGSGRPVARGGGWGPCDGRVPPVATGTPRDPPAQGGSESGLGLPAGRGEAASPGRRCCAGCSFATQLTRQLPSELAK